MDHNQTHALSIEMMMRWCIHLEWIIEWNDFHSTFDSSTSLIAERISIALIWSSHIARKKYWFAMFRFIRLVFIFNSNEKKRRENIFKFLFSGATLFRSPGFYFFESVNFFFSFPFSLCFVLLSIFGLLLVC